VIANSTLGWATGNIVLNAITLENLHIAAIHFDGDRDNQLSFWSLQDVTK
jgi:hypothetical protein